MGLVRLTFCTKSCRLLVYSNVPSVFQLNEGSAQDAGMCCVQLPPSTSAKKVCTLPRPCSEAKEGGRPGWREQLAAAAGQVASGSIFDHPCQQVAVKRALPSSGLQAHQPAQLAAPIVWPRGLGQGINELSHDCRDKNV